jgi:hypothetical protein
MEIISLSNLDALFSCDRVQDNVVKSNWQSWVSLRQAPNWTHWRKKEVTDQWNCKGNIFIDDIKLNGDFLIKFSGPLRKSWVSEYMSADLFFLSLEAFSGTATFDIYLCLAKHSPPDNAAQMLLAITHFAHIIWIILVSNVSI